MSTSIIKNDQIERIPATEDDASKAIPRLRQFIGLAQISVMARNCRGEEGQFFLDKIVELDGQIQSMPKSYQTDGQGGQAVAFLHYFTGSWDWYITEKDAGNGGQYQAFGLACGFEIELGYISIAEIIRAGAELDLHWTPTTLDAIKASRKKAA